jgi:glucose dehydrogenase
VNEILLDLGQIPDVVVWKNNTGVARSFDDPDRKIRYGLTGSGDILGVVAPHGRLLAVEAKTGGGTQSKRQKAFQRAIESVGGVYVVARSVADARAGLERARAPR